jgi:hypothetical protein
MRKNATVSIYVPVLTPNSEGTIIKTWGYKQNPAIAPAATFRADVQPHNLNEAEIELWELGDRKENTKELFGPRVPSVAITSRAAVTEDADGVTRYYDIFAANGWSHYTEALLVPVQGEDS